jgi:hypothetical protein
MIGDDKMFVCIECGGVFDEPITWEERHGLSTPPYEQLSGSPCCHGAYAEAFPCACCGEWITSERYVKTKDGDRFCEECFTLVELGDED